MRLLFQLAFRYLIARKRTHFINIISAFSFLGVMIGTAALVVIFSVFNGLDDMVKGLYSRFDADLKVIPVYGKTMPVALQSKFSNNNNIASVYPVVAENALLQYANSDLIVTLKGVDSLWIAHHVSDSGFVLSELVGQPFTLDGGTILGLGIASAINLSVNDVLHQVRFWVPAKGKPNVLQPETAIKEGALQPLGYFNIQNDINNQVALVALPFAQQLLGYNQTVSAFELQLKPEADLKSVQKTLSADLGAAYTVLNKEQQHAEVFNLIQVEKLWTWIILSFIIGIAALNLMGTLTMLVLEKKTDMRLLFQMGLPPGGIRNVFLIMGLFITLAGLLLGLVLGIGIVLGQAHYGWVTFSGNAEFVVNAYPVALQLTDLIWVCLTVLLLGASCTLWPAAKASKHIMI